MNRGGLLYSWAPELLRFTTTSFAIKNFSGEFLDVNPAFCLLTGYSREELVGRNHSIVTHPDDIDKTNAILARFARAELTDYLWTKRYVTKEGRVAECRKKLTVLDATDPLGKLILQIEDITAEQKLLRDAEEARRGSEREHEKLVITLRSIGDGVIGTDVQGRIDFMNDVAEELSGYRLVEVQGRPISEVFEIVHETTREKVPNPVEEVLLTGKTVELKKNTLLILPNGDTRAIADSAAPIRSPGGDVQGVVLVFRDMTEHQKLMSHIQRTARLESLGVLAGGIAHDFNNLLAGLYTNFELVSSAIPRASSAQVYLERIVRSFDRARGLTSQLLTFAKGGAPNRTPGDLGKTLREGAEFVLTGSPVLCRFDLAPDLGPCYYDATMISQVVHNLVINAIQAMPTGGTIDIKAENVVVDTENILHLNPGRYIMVSVRDEGMGIPFELQSRIFDPFYTTKPSGVGLGLATSHSILQKHDGTITVESGAGGGTTFRFYLPMIDGASASSPDPVFLSFRTGGPVLVMDDDATIRESLGEMLGKLGFQPVLADQGVSALKLFADARSAGAPFRVAFLDLTIRGGLGGRETARRIRLFDSTTPLVVISGYSDDRVVSAPTEYGFSDVVTKPFLRSDLISVLSRVLGN